MFASICTSMRAMNYCRIILLALIVASLVGCAHDQEGIKPAQTLFDEATLLASKGKVDKATEAFMEVRTYYPGHDLARKSLIATADLYFNEEQYDTAMESYKEYRLLYPTDTDASYSLYRVGMCYFNQLNTFDRDQTTTVQAIKTFEGFIYSYPDSPYVPDATEKLTASRQTLARHYIYIGKFYLRNHNKPAACKRFQYVRTQYPDIDLDEDLEELIAKSCDDGQETSPAPEPPQKEQ